MSILDHHPLNKALNTALSHASPVPDMPGDRLHSAAMAAFPSSQARPFWGLPVKALGALAASVIVSVGGFASYQSWQTEQKALSADADAFAAQLLSDGVETPS